MASLAARTYVQNIPGGTATTTIQMTSSQTIKSLLFSIVAAAAGQYEFSTSPASQIGTALPTSDVVARIQIGATASHIFVQLPVSVKVSAFQNLYVHCTGAGNVGVVTFS